MRSLFCLAATLLLVAALSPHEAGTAERPKVFVIFDASGAQFSGLEATARSLIAAHVAEQVQSACAKNWRFVDWATASPGSAPPGAWVWQVRVDEETRDVTLPSGQSATDSIVRLRHLVTAAGSGKSWELETGKATLYDYGQPKPSGARRLQQDLDRLIERHFTAEFLDRVGGSFLNEVQLADAIVVDATRKILIVPLRRCELRAGTRSQLKVKFRKDAASGAEVDGVLDLETFRDVEEGNHAGSIYGPVLFLDLPPDRLTPNNYWDDKFPTILGSIRDVRVYMLKYQLDAADGGFTSGGVILDPDQCGGPR